MPFHSHKFAIIALSALILAFYFHFSTSQSSKTRLLSIKSPSSTTMPRSKPRPQAADSLTTTTTLPATAIPPPLTFIDNLPLPKLIVFDLDYTLWPFWVDTHVTPPLKPSLATPPGQAVRDSTGGTYGFYPDVAGILHNIHQQKIQLGAASRTSAPELARKMLKLLHVPRSPSDLDDGQDSDRNADRSSAPLLAIDIFDYLEIYPGSKTTHFRRLAKSSGLPYSEMLFFDDETRNKNVETLGVVMHLIHDGVSRQEIDRGVEMWRKRNGRTTKES